MRLGLGTGSTAAAVRRSPRREGAGRARHRACRPRRRRAPGRGALGIPLTTLDADSAARSHRRRRRRDRPGELNLIKGGGGALLREKIVAAIARSAWWSSPIARSRWRARRVPAPRRGRALRRSPPPARASPPRWREWTPTGGRPAPRGRPSPSSPTAAIFIARLLFRHASPTRLHVARALADIPGVVEHGLFLDMAAAPIVGTPHGVANPSPLMSPNRLEFRCP